MCKESRAFLEELNSFEDSEKARQWMDMLTREHPYVLSELKGRSIARVILGSLNEGRLPLRPPLLAVNPDHLPSWHLTQGFVRAFEVDTVEEMPFSDVLGRYNVSTSLERVQRISHLTEAERTFTSEDLSLPAVRVVLSHLEVTSAAPI